MVRKGMALLLALTLACFPSGVAARAAEQSADTVMEGIQQVTINGDARELDEETLVNGSSPEVEEKAHTYLADSGGYTGSVGKGQISAGTAYELTPELLEYDWVYTLTRQYACEERNGVYFLQGASLLFLDLGSGKYSTVYTFDYSDGSVYYTGNKLYWAKDNKLVIYDLAAQKVVKTMEIQGLGWSSGIGVDASGRIYTYGDYEGFEERRLLLFDSGGKLLDSRTTPDPIYDFCGFSSDGTFYYIGYHNYIYWGYEHDMDTLFAGKVENNEFDDGDIFLLEYVGQQYFSEHQDYATLLSDTMLADHLGNVFDISDLYNSNMDVILSVSHETDEELSEYSDLSSIGVRMIYEKETNSLLAYSSGKNIFRYDLSTGEAVQKFVTQHYVFNLLDFGDHLIAIEREGDKFYIEMIGKSDFSEMKPVDINLNETDTYRDHTKDAVKEKYENAKIPGDIQVYESGYSLSPYKEAVLTDEMKNSLLEYSNFLRWLGGLTPFESAPDEIWSQGGKGTVLLTKIKELTHTPSQPTDMDAEFYQEAYDACNSSNLYGGRVSENRSANFMAYINGWLDDTANISNMELGHRFEFLQREGYQISYGATDRYLSQKVELYGGQVNTTGTVQGVDNNDYCYTWPSAGYVPSDLINKNALWSINMNSDKIGLSNEGMKVEIKDLDTGKVTDVSSSLGSSAYYGINQYFGYFKGMCFYFDPPEADNYSGKNYEVTISNLELPNGDPATMNYEVHFFDSLQKGDVDNNGEVNVSDLRMVLRHVCGKIQMNEDQKEAADVVTDGTVNISDLRKMLRYLCRKIDEL